MTNLPDAEIKELLAATSSPTLTHLLQQRGYRNVYFSGLHPVGPAARAVGRARTLRYTPHRPDLYPDDLSRNPQRLAIESIEPGEVLVAEAGGELGAGVLGDILLARVAKRGGAAFVVDGAVRDPSAIAELEIPVFVRGIHGAAHMRDLVPIGHDVPVRCGGCTVVPGDWIVCDANGVAVVPPDVAAEVATEGVEIDLKEVYVRELIDGGASTVDVYPPTEDNLQGFPAWKAARGRK